MKKNKTIRLNLFLLALSGLFWMTFEACGPKNTVHSIKESVEEEIDKRTVRLPKSGARLFYTNQTAAQIGLEKTNFLTSAASFIIEIVPNPGRPARYYNINFTRGVDYSAAVPVVHTYGTVRGDVLLAVKFPDAFRFNSHQTIRSMMTYYDIDHLDLFFTIDRPSLVSADPSLKPAYWMFQTIPGGILNVAGSPTQYQANVEMAIHDSDINIDDQVVTDQLRSFGVHLHDYLVSPNTGHLNIVPDTFSFYSIVIFERERRAAVTLHWNLSNADFQLVRNFLGTQAGRDFGTIFRNMNTFLLDGGTPLRATPLYRKLNTWLNDPPIIATP